MPLYLNKILIPLIIFLIILVVTLILRAVVMRSFRHWAERTNHHLDDLIVQAIKIPFPFPMPGHWPASGRRIFGTPLSLRFLCTPKTIHLVIVLSVVIGATHVSEMFFRYYIKRYDLSVSAPGLAIGVITGILWILGFLVALALLGVSIAPMLTALGIGGLAVGLALKDTLENIFAGINVLMEKSIRVGDCFRLESGQEGTVKDITWRTAPPTSISWPTTS